MKERRRSALSGPAVIVSLALHGVAYASLGLAPRHDGEQQHKSNVLLEVTTPPLPALEPEPEPPKDEPRSQAEEPAAPVRQVARATPPAAPEPPAPEPRAFDLRGVTLTNDSGDAAWSSVQGNGLPLDAPLRAVTPSGKASHSVPALKPASAPVERTPELVAAADLSEKPRPPALAAALRAHYPEGAKRRALSGSASLRLVISADGRVRAATILQDSGDGFGSACQKALLASRWSPPRDKSGRAVGTEVRYTCRFVVE